MTLKVVSPHDIGGDQGFDLEACLFFHVPTMVYTAGIVAIDPETPNKLTKGEFWTCRENPDGTSFALARKGGGGA